MADLKSSTQEREAAFQRHLQMSSKYIDAIHEAGDLAWFEELHPRRYVILAQLGLDDDIQEIDLRRALFLRRHR